MTCALSILNMVATTAPYKVALMVDIASSPATQCELVIHPYPDELVLLRNRVCAPFFRRWTILLRVSGFSEYDEAERFCNHWLTGTRGIARRVARGFFLCTQVAGVALEVTAFSFAESLERVLSSLSGDDSLERRLEQFVCTRTQGSGTSINRSQSNIQLPYRKRETPADIIRLRDLEEDIFEQVSRTLLAQFIQTLTVSSSSSNS